MSKDLDKYSMQIEIIKQKIKTGDIPAAAEKVGISPANAHKAYKRDTSKYHAAVIKALSEIIAFREVPIEATV